MMVSMSSRNCSLRVFLRNFSKPSVRDCCFMFGKLSYGRRDALLSLKSLINQRCPYFWLWFPCMTHDELCSYWASLDHVLCTLPENLYEQMCKYETELKKDLEFCKNRASLNSMQSKDFYHPISPCHPSLPGNIYPIDRTNVTDNELYCSMTSSEGY